MRITLGMMAATSLRNIQANQSRSEVLQNQITSGSRITRPSDDPIGAAQAISLQEGLDQSTQYGRNIDQATSWLNATDSALGSVTDALHRARELAVQASNGTLTNADRAAIQSEVTQLQQQVLNLTQSKYGAYFLFAGNRTDQPGFVQHMPSSSAGAYQGNQGQVQREISPGVSMVVNVDPAATFDSLFSALDQLQTGISANDTTTLQASIGTFDTALDALNISRSQVGARVNRLDTLKQRQESVAVNLTELLSQVKDVDMAAAITNFTMAQNVYEASLRASAKVVQTSLLDYLR
jgi:flagellar hook-associated protein 3 FlgL